jgi:chromosome partitioning protein
VKNQKHYGITLGLCNQKGGAGKTTSAAALAAIYGERGLKVLTVDNDPQGNLSLQFGVDCLVENNLPGTTADLYLEKRNAHEIAYPTSFKGVDIVPTSVDLAEVEMNLPSKQGSDMRLSIALEKARELYDLIILDAPPNLGKLAVNVLVASDWYLVPVEGPWAFRSMQSLIDVAEKNAKYYKVKSQLLGIFLTMVDRTKITQGVRDAAQSRYPDHLLKSEIRRSTLARESAALETPLPLYAADSAVAQDYKALANEIAKRVGIKL